MDGSLVKLSQWSEMDEEEWLVQKPQAFRLHQQKKSDIGRGFIFYMFLLPWLPLIGHGRRCPPARSEQDRGLRQVQDVICAQSRLCN